MQAIVEAKEVVKKEKPAQLTKPTRFRLAQANFFRNGTLYPKGSIYTLPAGERPSVTWVEVDENGHDVKPQPKASDHPVHPPKYAAASSLPPAGTEPEPEVKHDGKHEAKTEVKETKDDKKHHRASDKTPL